MREMKNSGIAWIGEIPREWEMSNFRYNGSFVKGKLPTTSNDKGIGLPIIGASEMLGKECRVFTEKNDIPICDKKDILILWDGANAGIIANGLSGVVSSTAVKYTCSNANAFYQYVYYMFKSVEPYFKSKVNGTTIPHMNIKYINEVPLLQPSLKEQHLISSYLDAKCSEIDSALSLQEQMISELRAYKQSLITETVTHGLNPNAKMKNSGVEWIGEIPEGWEVRRIKFVAELWGRIGFRGYKSEDLNKEGVGAITLSPSNMKESCMDYSSVTYLSWEKYEESPEIQIRNNDILLVKTGSSYGKACFVINLPREATINPQILRVVSKIDGKYLCYYMHTPSFRYEVECGVVGGTIPTISQEKINNFCVPVPPLSEQRSIATFLDEKCAEIDALIVLREKKMEALKEYKKSLIYECVTGKKQVI